MLFNYAAKTKEGENQTGTVEASSRELAIDILQRHGLLVVSLETREAMPLWVDRFKLFRKVSLKDLSIFARQFATLLEARVPIVDALRTLYEQVDNKYLKSRIAEISADIEGGLALSAALARQQRIFSSFFISMVKSGEASGNLEDVFLYLADYLEKQYDLNTKVKGALWYPVLILFFFFVVAVAMVILVIPQLESFLREFGADLPLPTKIIIGASQFFRDWLWIFALLTLAAFFAAARYVKTPEGRWFWDGLKIRLPIFGRLFKCIYITHFSETFSVLLEGGVSINQALLISGDVVNNEVYKDIIMKTEEAIRRGEMTSRVMAAYPEQFPPIVSQMLAIGEKTGRVSELLKRVATFYRRELDKIVANLVVLIEPILIIGLGAMVGLLLAAVLLPIYQLVTTISLGG